MHKERKKHHALLFLFTFSDVEYEKIVRKVLNKLQNKTFMWNTTKV